MLLSTGEDREYEVIELETERPRQRRRLSGSESNPPVVDLTHTPVTNSIDNGHTSGSSRRERAPLRGRAPIPREDVEEITLNDFPFKSWSLSLNGAVELATGEFLRINQITNRITMKGPEYNVGKSEIFLKGKLFVKATPLQYLHNKKNEVVLKDDGVQVALEEVQCPRELIMTNAPFPEFRGEEIFVCRWVWGIIEGMRYQGMIRRLSEPEADEGYRLSGYLLRSQWRSQKLNELRFQEEQKRQAAIEKSRQRKAEIKAKNAYTIDLERDPFFGGGEKQPLVVARGGLTEDNTVPSERANANKIIPPRLLDPRPSSSKTTCPVTPQKLFVLDEDEGYYTGTRSLRPQLCPQSANLTLPSFQFGGNDNPRDSGSISNPASPIISIEDEIEDDEIEDDEIEEDMPLLWLHREDTFTNYQTGQTFRTSHTMDLRQVQSSQTSKRKRTPDESLNTNPLTKNVFGFSMVRQSGRLGHDTTISSRPRNPLSDPSLPKGPPKYTFGDAFCGAGGMSRAAEMSHFRVTWGVDCNEPAIQAYQMNFPAATPFHTRVDKLLRNLNENIVVDVLHISPPCQPYSPAHTVAGKDDESNEAALFAINDLLEASRPRFATVEQTDGILHHHFLPALLSPFLDKGFSVAFKVLHGSEYGVPQLRKRLVVLAAGPGETLPPWPAPTHYAGGNHNPNLIPTPTIHDILSEVPLDATEHEFRFYNVPRPPRDPHRQCRTLMAGGSDQEYHPSGLRPLTIREKACIQTFPYDHSFSGSCTTKQRQVGNAVPPMLGKAILTEVRKALEKADEEDRLRREQDRGEFEVVEEGFEELGRVRGEEERDEREVIEEGFRELGGSGEKERVELGVICEDFRELGRARDELEIIEEGFRVLCRAGEEESDEVEIIEERFKELERVRGAVVEEGLRESERGRGGNGGDELRVIEEGFRVLRGASEEEESDEPIMIGERFREFGRGRGEEGGYELEIIEGFRELERVRGEVIGERFRELRRATGADEMNQIVIIDERFIERERVRREEELDDLEMIEEQFRELERLSGEEERDELEVIEERFRELGRASGEEERDELEVIEERFRELGRVSEEEESDEPVVIVARFRELGTALREEGRDEMEIIEERFRGLGRARGEEGDDEPVVVGERKNGVDVLEILD